MKACATCPDTVDAPMPALHAKELRRVLEGTVYVAELKKLVPKVREKLVLILDKRQDPLAAMGTMRRKIADEASVILTRMRQDAGFMSQMTQIVGVPSPGVGVQTTSQYLKMAPPSALRNVVDLYVDDIMETAFRQAQEITARR